MMNQTDWYKRSTDELYDYFNNLGINDQVTFLVHLFEHFPKLDIPWIEFIEDTKDPLIFMHQPEKVEELVDLFDKTFPCEYETHLRLHFVTTWQIFVRSISCIVSGIESKGMLVSDIFDTDIIRYVNPLITIKAGDTFTCP